MLNDLKAEFSGAYVRAVAHAAGYFVQGADRIFDGDGVDLTVMSKGNGGVVRSPRLDLQLKATSTPVTEDPFPYDLDVKNYNELCDDSWQVARILVVVIMPPDIAQWTEATETELLLRHCGYWSSLRGQPSSQNAASVRIRISRSACFHVTPLTQMMDRIRQGGTP